MRYYSLHPYLEMVLKIGKKSLALEKVVLKYNDFLIWRVFP